MRDVQRIPLKRARSASWTRQTVAAGILLICTLLLAASAGCVTLPFSGAGNTVVSSDLSLSFNDPDTGISFLYPAGAAVVRAPAGESVGYRILIPGLPPGALELFLLPKTPYPEQVLSAPPGQGSGFTVIESGPVTYQDKQGSGRTVGYTADGKEVRRQEIAIALKNTVLIGSLTASPDEFPKYTPILSGILSSVRIDQSRGSRVVLMTPTPSPVVQSLDPAFSRPLFLRGDVIQSTPLDEGYNQERAHVVLISDRSDYTLKPVRKFDYYDGWYADGNLTRLNRSVAEKKYSRLIERVDPARTEAMIREPLERYRERSNLSPYEINYNTTNWQLFSPNERFKEFHFDPDQIIPPYLEGYDTVGAEDRNGVRRGVQDPLIAGLAGGSFLVYRPGPASGDYGQLTGIVLEAIRFKDRDSANAYYQGLFSRDVPVKPGGLDAAYGYTSRDGAAIATYTMLLGDTAVISTAFDHAGAGGGSAGEKQLEPVAKSALYTCLKRVL